MTRIFNEGFEGGHTFWWTNFGSGAAIHANYARSGIYGMKIDQDDSATYTLATGLSEAYLRIPFYLVSYASYAPVLFYWRNGTTSLGSVKINYTTHKLEIYAGGSLWGTGTITINTSTWYVLEVHIKISDTVGVLDVRLDGFSEITVAAGDTKPDANTTFTNLYWYAGGASTAPTMYFDDIAINDTNGAVDNSWCGDGRFIAISPNANGDQSDLDGSDGNSVDNYALVDEVPANDETDYVESAVSDEYDLYNMATPSWIFGSVDIKRIWLEARVRNTVAGGQCKLGVKATTENWGDAINTPTSYAYVKDAERLANHDTAAAWTASDLASIQAGFKVV